MTRWQSSDSSHHSDSYSEAASLVRSVADVPVVTVVVTTTADANVATGSKAKDSLDTETLHRVYVPRWKVTNDFILDDPYVCRDRTDRLAPYAIYTAACHGL
ncbi:hypothetical protein Tco_1102821 [Tanacetum coccineum]